MKKEKKKEQSLQNQTFIKTKAQLSASASALTVRGAASACRRGGRTGEQRTRCLVFDTHLKGPRVLFVQPCLWWSPTASVFFFFFEGHSLPHPCLRAKLHPYQPPLLPAAASPFSALPAPLSSHQLPPLFSARSRSPSIRLRRLPPPDRPPQGSRIE